MTEMCEFKKVNLNMITIKHFTFIKIILKRDILFKFKDFKL